MIIYRPELTRRNGEIEVSARVEFNHTIPNVPKRLWFRFPESCADYLTDRGDGFLSCMLIPAMHCGEDIEVPAQVSPKLLYNLKEYQYLFESKYHIVTIKFPK